MKIISDILKKCGYIRASELTNEQQWNILAGGRKTSSGMKVNPETAMRVSAVWACVKILAETIGSLPLILYRRLPNGDRERATDHPLYNLFHNSPNHYQTALEFKEMMQGHLALRGNAYSEIIWKFGGYVEELKPLHPNRVNVKKTREGVLRYEITDPQGGQRIIEWDNILHIRGLSSDGIKGLAPITQARETIGLTMAADQFGSTFFGNGANVGNVLEHPTTLSDPALKRLKESIAESYAGSKNAHKTLVLEEGMKWQHLGVTPEDGQFLETRKFQITDIARIFRIPPHLLSHLEKSSFNNIVQQSLEFLIYTMQPWFTRWEQAITKSLIIAEEDKQKYYFEFLVDALLRGDIKARFEAYAKGVQWGWFTRNEVRRKENLNSGGPELDKFLTPMNMIVVGDEPGKIDGTTSDKSKPFGIIIEDASKKIANAELRAFVQHDQKLGGWQKLFNAKHTSYIRTVIEPIHKALDSKADLSYLIQLIVMSNTFDNVKRIEQIKAIIINELMKEVDEIDENEGNE